MKEKSIKILQFLQMGIAVITFILVFFSYNDYEKGLILPENIKMLPAIFSSLSPDIFIGSILHISFIEGFVSALIRFMDLLLHISDISDGFFILFPNIYKDSFLNTSEGFSFLFPIIFIDSLFVLSNISFSFLFPIIFIDFYFF